jgi:nucleotide-binding universal stress UspA family protein
MYQHILISTDGSEIAQKGLDHGLALAKAFGARVTIVMVSDTLLPYAGAGDGTTLGYQDFVAIQKEVVERILADAQDAARRAGVESETVWQENISPAEAIVDTAKTRGCDLIAMASHGRRGLSRLLIGSVTSAVLVLSTVPVLVVR